MTDLWQRYTNVLHAKGIRPPCDRWYVIRAEEFLKNHKGKQLKEYTCNLVETYLSDLGRAETGGHGGPHPTGLIRCVPGSISLAIDHCRWVQGRFGCRRMLAITAWIDAR